MELYHKSKGQSLEDDKLSLGTRGRRNSAECAIDANIKALANKTTYYRTLRRLASQHVFQIFSAVIGIDGCGRTGTSIPFPVKFSSPVMFPAPSPPRGFRFSSYVQHPTSPPLTPPLQNTGRILLWNKRNSVRSPTEVRSRD